MVGAGRRAASLPQRAGARGRRPTPRPAALRDDALLGDRGGTGGGLGEIELEFAQIWKELPKVVFSTTLESVEGNARLVREGAVEETARLKEESTEDLAVGGAGLAGSLIEAGLVDDFRLFVAPVVLGAGTPFFPALEKPIDLELVETRNFDAPATYLRYRLRR